MVCRAESGTEAISAKVRPEVGPWIPVQTKACQGHSMLLQNVLVHEQVHFEMDVFVVGAVVVVVVVILVVVVVVVVFVVAVIVVPPRRIACLTFNANIKN